MIRIQVDLGALEEWPSHRLAGFSEALLLSLPGLRTHGCSDRTAGGFVGRLEEGTWLGHVTEHVALELQSLAGHPVSRGKTRSVRGAPGRYNILYGYEDEHVGLTAGLYALQLVESLLPQALRGLDGARLLGQPLEPFELVQAVADLRRLAERRALGPTTRSLAAEARRRGIPVRRLDEHSFVQLGWGSRQKWLRASITGQTSHLAVEAAGNKALTKSLLRAAGLPAPEGEVVTTAEAAVAAARRIGFPVVTKPLDANHGRGVNVGLADDEAVAWGFEQARAHARRVIVEQALSGRDYRCLVVGGKLVAVAERAPAQVIGDGRRSIEALIAQANDDPRRGVGHEKAMTRIQVDDHVLDNLRRQGLALASVPAEGQTVILRRTANLSTGGAAIDRTDAIHPQTAQVCEQAAAVVGLDVAGIDMVCPDIAAPLARQRAGIVEINAAPGFRMHLEPAEGRARDVARPVIASLFPRAADARIPVFAVTGTNGKSTTVRMLASILKSCGLRVGLTNTSGIYIDGRQIAARDASGPKSARQVLNHPAVDAGVFEVARGGLLREGLGFDWADAGAVLNISEDHLGLKGIASLQDLADVKSVVVESVARRGCSVLNADDPLTLRMARVARGRLAWFSMRGGDDMPGFLARHIAEGGLAAAYDTPRDMLTLYRNGEGTDLCRASELPATLGGAAAFNVANALAAALMTFGWGADPDRIVEGLKAFQSSFEDNPGRLNVYDGHPFRVVVDYAHNPAALQALGELVRAWRPGHGRVIGMVSIPGDRRDEDIRRMGELAAEIFDEMVFREAPDGRGRGVGEVNALLSEGAIRAGAEPGRVRRIIDELEAARYCLQAARPGDLVVLMPSAVDAVWRTVAEFRPRPEAASASQPDVDGRRA